MLVLAVTAWLERSAIGHRLVAIRENEDAAQALGVNLLRYKLFATALSAFLTALGGTLYAHYVTFIDPHTLLNMNMALEITIYAIVGGIGTLLGPLLGALFLVPLAEIVRATLGQSYAGVHLVVYGAVLIAVILVRAGRLHGALPFVARQPRRSIGGPRRPGSDGSGRMSLLAVRGIDQGFRRAARRLGAHLQCRGRQHRRPDRPERRRQDDDLLGDLGLSANQPRARSSSKASASPASRRMGSACAGSRARSRSCSRSRSSPRCRM